MALSNNTMSPKITAVTTPNVMSPKNMSKDELDYQYKQLSSKEKEMEAKLGGHLALSQFFQTGVLNDDISKEAMNQGGNSFGDHNTRNMVF